MAKRRSRDGAPEGGWLGPPPTEGLKPLAIATSTDRKGNWKWREIPQTKKDKELREEWNRRLAKANKRGNYRFKWPPKKED